MTSTIPPPPPVLFLYYRLRAKDVAVSDWTKVLGGRDAMGTLVNVAYDNGVTVEFRLQHA